MEGFTFSPSAGPSAASNNASISPTLSGDFIIGKKPKGVVEILAQNISVVVLVGVAVWLIRRKK